MRNQPHEDVLIGVLRGKNTEEHLEWIMKKRSYFMPLLKNQDRQYHARWFLLYIPQKIREPSAIRYKAKMVDIKVKRRDEIKTGWISNQDSSNKQIVYKMDSLQELKRPIINMDHKGRGQRISRPRWTSKLAMEKAVTINELLLEYEPEWRLNENLKARGIEFKLMTSPPETLDPDRCSNHVWFVILKDGLRIRYIGDSGFVMKNRYGVEKVFLYLENLLKHCFGDIFEDGIIQEV